MSSRLALLLIGEPGVGKSSVLLAALRASVGLGIPVGGEVPYSRYPGGIVLGNTHQPPYGTDATPLHSMRVIFPLLDDLALPTVVGEGSRFACQRFIDGMAERGYRLRVIALAAPPQVASDRRMFRALDLGHQQNDQWVRGRRTQSLVAARQWCAPGDVWDATLPIPELAVRLSADPAFAKLGPRLAEGVAETH